MVPRINSQNITLKRSSILMTLLFFVFSFSYGQAPPVFTTCPATATITLPAGGGPIGFTSTNIPALLGVAAIDPDGTSTVTYSASPSFVSCIDVGIVPITVDATDIDGTTNCLIAMVTVVDGGPLAVSIPTFDAVLDATGNVTVTTGDIDNGSSTCGVAAPALSILEAASFTCADAGSMVTLTLQAMSGGQTSTSTTTVSIVDNMAPTVTAGAQANIAANNDAGLCSAVVNYTDPTFDDNCGGAAQAGTMSAGMASGSAFPVGTTTVTFEFTDAGGTMASHSFDVVVTDTEAPTVSAGAQANIAQNNDAGICGAVVTYTDPTFDDNCGGMGQAGTMSAGMASGSTFPVGTTTVTFDFTDVAGAMASHSFDVVVSDTEDPTVMTSTANITMDNDPGLCSAVVTYVAPVFADNCDGMSLAGTRTAGPASGTAFPVGTTTVTYEYSDLAGNGPASSSFTVTVNDVEAPNAAAINPGDITMNSDAGVCQATVTWATLTSADNCPGTATVTYTAIDEKGNSVTILTAGASDFGDFPIGTTIVTFTVSDGVGNSDMGTFNVIVEDNEPTVVTCPPTQTLHFANCDTDAMLPDYRGLPNYFDNCPSGFTVTQDPAPGTLLNTISTPANGEFIAVTITVTDNTPSATNMGATCTFMVQLDEDNTPAPTTTGTILPAISGECGPLTVVAPTALDECGNLICGEPFPPVATDLGVPCATATGPCVTSSRSSTDTPIQISTATGPGNTITSVITIPGNTPPLTIEDVNVSLEIAHTWAGDIDATLTSPSGTTIVLFDQPGVPATGFGCSQDNVNLSFDDDATDTAIDLENTCNTSFTGFGNPGPPYAIDGSFQPQVPLAMFNGENSEGDWTLTVTDNAGFDGGSLLDWTLDICENSSTTTVAEYEFPVGSHNITWVFDDGNGNSVSQLQQINVTEDIQGPTFNCQDLLLELDASGNATLIVDDLLESASISLTSGDNQSGTLGNTLFTITTPIATTFSFDWDFNNPDPGFEIFGYFLNGAGFGLSNQNASGSTTVALNAGDEFSFVAQTVDNTFGAATVTITNFSPGFSGDFGLINWTFENQNADGSFSSSAGEAADNCSDASALTYNVSQTSFTCADVGSNTVTVTVTDAAGNSTSCTPNVIVEDNIDPVFDAMAIPADVTVSCDNVPVATLPTATDNCGILGVSDNETSNQINNPSLCNYYNYTITRTWTATDVNGNSVTASQNIVVEDNDAPTFDMNLPTSIEVIANQTSCDGNVTLVIDTDDLADNCAATANLTITNNSPYGNGANSASGTYPEGFTTVQFTATDPCGNASTHTVTVLVKDEVAPIASCKTNINLVIPAGQDSIIILPSLVDNGSFDNCSSTITYSVSPNVFYCAQADGVTPHNVVLTVTDNSGNVSQCLTSVIIQENTGPIVMCQDISVSLNSAGIANIVPSDVLLSATDCSGIDASTYSVNPSQFDITQQGTTQTVFLTVADIHGNFGVCTANVTVELPRPCLDIAGSVAVDTFNVGTGINCIPVTVTDFTNVRSFQQSIYIDPTVAEFVGICSHNLPSDPIVNVNATNDTLTISYFSTSTSFMNGDVIFEIQVDVLGALNSSTELVIGSDPTPQEYIVEYGGNLITLTPPYCGTQDGYIEVVNSSLAASGNIYTWDLTTVDTVIDMTVMPFDTTVIVNNLMTSQPVNNVDILKYENGLPIGGSLAGTTDINGDYSITASNLAGGINLVLDPTKNVNWLNYEPFPVPPTGPTFQGVTSFDLFQIQQHIVNNTLFISNYQLIAADANGSGDISTLDLVLLQDIIVGNSSSISTNESWRFVPAADSIHLDPLPALPGVPNYTQPITLNPFTSATGDLDWVAVKIGNVVGPVVTHFLTSNTTETRNGEAFIMQVEDKSYKTGELVQVPFYAKDYNAFAAWQFTLDFDKSSFAYQDMIPGALSNFTEGNLGLNNIEQGKLAASWFATGLKSIEDNEVLFTLEFEVLADIEKASDIFRITNGLVKSESYLADGSTGDINLEFIAAEVTSATFELYQNNPNPFTDKTMISFTLPKSGFASLKLFDVSGRILKVVEGDMDKGFNQVEVLRNELPSTGVIYYKLESSDNTATKKMIILE